MEQVIESTKNIFKTGINIIRKTQNIVYPNQIPILKINGIINETSVELVQRSLERISTNRMKALSVIINSPGGSLPQSYQIITKLNIFKQRYNIPLLTFGEDIAASCGYYILCIGDKVYTDHSTQISCIHQHKYQELKQKEGEQKLSFNKNNQTNSAQFLDHFNLLQERQSQKYLPEINQKQNEHFISHVLQYRKDVINFNSNEEGEKHLNQRSLIFKEDKIYQGEEAQQIGLIDELGIYQDVLSLKYPEYEFKYVSDEVQNEIIAKERY